MRLMIALCEARDLRRQHLRLKKTVDAVADAQGGFFRLDVNIAGPFVGGFDKNFVDQLDDRGFLGLFGQFAVVGFETFEEFDVVALLHHLLTVSPPTPKCCLDKPGDFARTGQNRLNFKPGQAFAIRRWHKRRYGSPVATISVPFSREIGIKFLRCTSLLGITASVSALTTALLRSTSSIPNSSATALRISSSRPMFFSRRTSWARRSGCAAIASSARRKSASLS